MTRVIFKILGTMCVYDWSIEFCTWMSKRVVFNFGIFIWWTRDLTLYCSIFPWETCFLAPYGFPVTCTEVKRKKQREKSGTKTVTEPKGRATRHISSLLIHHPFQLFVILKWCVSCVPPCCSHHHQVTGHGDILLYQKSGIKLHPSATIDVLNQAFMLPHPQAKACSVVCVLEPSSVHTVACWDNNNHHVSVCGFTECEWVCSCCISYCRTKVGLYWPFCVWR